MVEKNGKSKAVASVMAHKHRSVLQTFATCRTILNFGSSNKPEPHHCYIVDVLSRCFARSNIPLNSMLFDAIPSFQDFSIWFPWSDSLIGFHWMIDWLIDWLNDWLIGWLVDWLIGWLVDWSIDSSTSAHSAIHLPCYIRSIFLAREQHGITSWYISCSDVNK